MIKILIQSDGKKILDIFENKDTTLKETATALFVLKQIEQQLIDMKFDTEFEIEENKK